MEIEIGGLIAGTEYDVLEVTGTLTLGGTLSISLYDGFSAGAIPDGFTFEILQADTILGAFDSVQVSSSIAGLFNLSVQQSPTGDDDFVRVTVADVDGRLLAAPLSRGAGVITSLVRADGLAHVPRFSEGVEMGQEAEIMLYRPLHEIRQTVLAMGSHDPMLDLLAQFAQIGVRV